MIYARPTQTMPRWATKISGLYRGEKCVRADRRDAQRFVSGACNIGGKVAPKPHWLRSRDLHIGGVRPSLPTLTRAAVNRPSG